MYSNSGGKSQGRALIATPAVLREGRGYDTPGALTGAPGAFWGHRMAQERVAGKIGYYVPEKTLGKAVSNGCTAARCSVVRETQGPGP